MVKVALRHQEKRAHFAKLLEDLRHARQEFGRAQKHLASMIEQDAEIGRLDLAVTELHGRLDHRQHETLHAVAEQFEVVGFGLEQFRLGIVGRRPFRQQIGERVFRCREMVFVVPQRVVGVEADCLDIHGSQKSTVMKMTASLERTRRDVTNRTGLDPEPELLLL